MLRSRIALAWLLSLIITPSLAQATSFTWERYKGERLSLLLSNHPWTDAISNNFTTFTNLTGIRLVPDIYQEAQMRQRLTILLQARSPDVDVFMSLKSREGLLYSTAGWYYSLNDFLAADVSPDFNFSDFSPALVRGETFDGRIVGLPINIEGPVVYYRKDLFARCRLSIPESLDELLQVASKIKECLPGMVPITTRGLASAIPYTFSNVLHNFGGTYLSSDGRSNLCSREGIQAMNYYARLLREFGPPQFENYTFYQNTELFGSGRAVMSFESSNELARVLQFPGRSRDTGVFTLPKGPGGDRPTVIGWGISVSAYSRRPAAAWYFIQWATSPRVQLQLALNGIAPPRRSIWRDPRFLAWINAEPARRDWARALIKISEQGTSEVGPNIIRQPEAREIIGQAILRIALGRATPEAAACDADRQINSIITSSSWSSYPPYVAFFRREHGSLGFRD